ncbi:P-II family nitrogen regulator [Oceanidesulfovibrio marinus]|uniref:P-II family nitrogen regulator n=1 Tax=Oceanidesulfovibrio marinus TaxID=370038 RepID=A0A6P1ZDB6_9BACT|nr:P-II family nitrogen regulator [Oceanidesulfovibrio marinus]TVM31246.1 P-II family nitrogen regulator [Oceanidesulfovibrio marinus]
MKKIEIIMRPFRMENVKQALADLGIQGMTVAEAKGFGRQGGRKEHYRGAEQHVEFVSKVKIEVVVDDAVLDDAVDAIINAARTGQVGDGKIFIYPVEEAIRIRTGDRGTEAL